MALFNKLFASRKSNPSNLDNGSEKHFGFTKEQVRVVLFRECDFRGRKLLFDSTAVKKIQINASFGTENTSSDKNDQFGSFAEISNGFGYMYIKPPTDSSHLAEMIFGLVAMSYRGAYFKIHSLESPSRLMLTQVFPSPKYVQRRKSSTSSHGHTKVSNQSLDQSLHLDDSGASISEHLSVHSTSSDTFLICRPNNPVDVFQTFCGSSSSAICDSGVYGDRSCSSFDGNRHFNMIPFWESTPVKGCATSFSNSTLYKRWLRSSSLEHSVNSSNSSMEETFNKSHQRTSKLGLAFIIHLTSEQEEPQVQFFMEHIALIESMLWRARQATEIAYLRPSNFLSVLMKMVNLSSVWLTNLLSGPLLHTNLWRTLQIKSDNCDNNNIKCTEYGRSETNNSSESVLHNLNSELFSNSYSSDNMNLLSENQSEKYEFSLFNITRIIKNEWDYFNSKLFGNCDGNNLAEKFVQEFCELLDTIDVKDTNFFMSTLLTAVLTHHLGWVATCLPQEKEDQIFLNLDIPFNPLWGQLCDLYGAVGHPTKMAQTVVMGEKKKDIIAKIVNCLTYFIRCSELERKNSIRPTVNIDNKTADYICHKNSCIPKENFKKYKDHLREMLSSNKLKNDLKGNNEVSKFQKFSEPIEKRLGKGLCKSKKSLYNLRNLDEKCAQTDSIGDTTKSSGLHKNSNWLNLKELNNLVHVNSYNSLKTNCDIKMNEEDQKVVFVLGDDEKLVNINRAAYSQKKSRNPKEDKIEYDKAVDSSNSGSKNSVPNFLESIFKKYESFEEEFSNSVFKDEDFIKYESESCIKPSTSWASLQQAEEDIVRESEEKLKRENYPASSLGKPFVRSQSVPPESKDETVKEEVKAKYRYSGVKFSLHQYPQVVTNYMRSKNLEMSNLSFSEITKRFDQISLEKEEDSTDYSQFEINSDEMEALQTPSNASELEYTSEITVDMSKHRNARESSEKSTYVKTSIPNISESMEKDWIIKEGCFSECKASIEDAAKMRIIYFPMPKSEISTTKKESISYPSSLMRGVNDEYIPDLVLQGTSAPKKDWEATLKNELTLSSQHCLLDQPLAEAVAIIADTDTWEVQLVSSHTYVIDKNSSGVKVGMSQLISSMLDSLLKMWKLQVPPQMCMMHIEQRLQALCVTSRAVAQLLLATEFCSMEFLTSSLHLEVNDVPLLLAVASTFSPQVTQKYGISFH